MVRARQAYSYSNTLATLAGIAAPEIAASFVRQRGEADGYRATFAVFGPIVGLPAVAVFCWLASAQRVTSLLGRTPSERDEDSSLMADGGAAAPSSPLSLAADDDR